MLPPPTGVDNLGLSNCFSPLVPHAIGIRKVRDHFQCTYAISNPLIVCDSIFRSIHHQKVNASLLLTRSVISQSLPFFLAHPPLFHYWPSFMALSSLLSVLLAQLLQDRFLLTSKFHFNTTAPFCTSPPSIFIHFHLISSVLFPPSSLRLVSSG